MTVCDGRALGSQRGLVRGMRGASMGEGARTLMAMGEEGVAAFRRSVLACSWSAPPWVAVRNPAGLHYWRAAREGHGETVSTLPVEALSHSLSHSRFLSCG